MRPPDSWRKARLTLAIAAVTAACWLFASTLGLGDWAAAFGGFIPARVGPGDLEATAWVALTPLTATLVHADLIHLGFNLLVLLFCGRAVENVLAPVSLAILYVLGAYAAAGAQYLVDPASMAPMIGASGAISAVLGAYAMLFGRNRVSVVSGRLAVWINAVWLMAAWVVLNILVGIASARGGFLFTGEGISVAVAAHIGGFLIGILLANPLLRFVWRKA